MTQDPTQRRRGPLLLGLSLLAIAVAGIVHFVVSAALAKFPDAVLSSGRNWYFIGGHGLLGLLGLVLTGLAHKQNKRSR